MSDAKTWDLIEELRAVVADAEAVLSAKGTTVLEQGKATLSELESGGRERIEAIGEDLTRYVREHPWQSIGVAAGVGLVLGVLLKRR